MNDRRMLRTGLDAIVVSVKNGLQQCHDLVHKFGLETKARLDKISTVPPLAFMTLRDGRALAKELNGEEKSIAKSISDLEHSSTKLIQGVSAALAPLLEDMKKRIETFKQEIQEVHDIVVEERRKTRMKNKQIEERNKQEALKHPNKVVSMHKVVKVKKEKPEAPKGPPHHYRSEWWERHNYLRDQE